MSSLAQCELRRVPLDLAPDSGMVDVNAALGDEFLVSPVGEAVPAIPTNGTNNDLGFKLPPVEQPWLPVHCASQGTSEVHQIFATLTNEGSAASMIKGCRKDDGYYRPIRNSTNDEYHPRRGGESQ